MKNEYSFWVYLRALTPRALVAISDALMRGLYARSGVLDEPAKLPTKVLYAIQLLV